MDGNWAAVQPQDGRSAVIWIGVVEVFVAKKVNGALASPGFALYSFDSLSKTSEFGLGTAATTGSGWETVVAGACAWALTATAQIESNNVKRLIERATYQHLPKE